MLLDLGRGEIRLVSVYHYFQTSTGLIYVQSCMRVCGL